MIKEIELTEDVIFAEMKEALLNGNQKEFEIAKAKLSQLQIKQAIKHQKEKEHWRKKVVNSEITFLR